MNVRSVIGIGACALVLAGLGLGFSEIGSPSLNRSRDIDARLQQAISDVARANTNRREDSPNKGVVFPDAMSGDLRAPIAFEPESKTTYRLCATFRAEGNRFSLYGEDSQNWEHPAGRYCYRFPRRSGRQYDVYVTPLPHAPQRPATR